METDYVRFAPGDRVAQASNASFDALTFEAWGALMNGATLVGIPRDVLLSPAAFRETLREERITTLYQTTALLNQLSREQPDVFATLREVLFGGQAADAASVRRAAAGGQAAAPAAHVRAHRDDGVVLVPGRGARGRGRADGLRRAGRRGTSASTCWIPR